MSETENWNQEAKADKGKPRLSLVPLQILTDIARIREYGVNKYGNNENWRSIEIERYRDAAFRHFVAYLNDPQGVDEESGLPHLSHLACNIAFLCELEEEVRENNNKDRIKKTAKQAIMGTSIYPVLHPGVENSTIIEVLD